LSPEEDKKLHETKAYQYYPTPIYEGEQGARHPVEVYHHNNSSKMDTDNTHQQHHPTSHQLEKVKGEYESGVSNVWYPGSSYYGQNCGRFEGKSASSGYYPMTTPTAALNI
jgi:meiosis-specific transcription factor NDT80